MFKFFSTVSVIRLFLSEPFSLYSWRNDTNVILADEMGLGKTVQSVSMLGFLQVLTFGLGVGGDLDILFLFGQSIRFFILIFFLQNAQQIHGPFLVVVPLSTLSNWAKEFKKWLPDMNVIIYVGARASREVCDCFWFCGFVLLCYLD